MSDNEKSGFNDKPSGMSNWRDTARFPKFIIFDARCLFPIFIWLLHICKETFYIAVIGIVFFSILEFFKITPMVIVRSFRSFLSGPKRSNYDPIVYRRRLKS
jgi:hypothetical protein